MHPPDDWSQLFHVIRLMQYTFRVLGNTLATCRCTTSSKLKALGSCGVWQAVYDSSEPGQMPLTEKFELLNRFQRLMVLRALRPDKVHTACMFN